MGQSPSHAFLRNGLCDRYVLTAHIFMVIGIVEKLSRNLHIYNTAVRARTFEKFDWIMIIPGWSFVCESVRFCILFWELMVFPNFPKLIIKKRESFCMICIYVHSVAMKKKDIKNTKIGNSVMITHQDIRYLNRNHHAPTLFTPELLKSIIYFKEFIWFNKTD